MIERRVIGHRQIAQVAVEHQQIRFVQDRLQTVRQQHRIELIDVGAQRLRIVAAQIERQAHRVEPVALRHLALDRLRVFARQRRFGGVTDRRAFDLGDLVASRVLRLQRHGQHHHGVFRQAIEQREHVIAGAAFGGQVTDLRRVPQSLNRDHRVRQVVEPPGADSCPSAAWSASAVRPGRGRRQAVIAGIRRDLQQLVGIATGDRRFGLNHGSSQS